MGSTGLDSLTLLDIVSSAEATPKSPLRDYRAAAVVGQRIKRNKGGAVKKEMQPITGAPVSVVDNEQRWQNLRITPNLNLPLRLKQNNKLLWVYCKISL